MQRFITVDSVFVLDSMLTALTSRGNALLSVGTAWGAGACDNPDALDKEAGALALRGFISLYQATADEQWVRRSTLRLVRPTSFHVDNSC